MSDVKRWTGAAWASDSFQFWNGSSWAAGQAKAWNGSAWVNVPPTAVTTVFNVMDANGLPHGAHADGVTNDSDHIQAAFTAAHNNSAAGAHSTVYFPPGTYLVNAGWNMPTIRTNDWYPTTPTGASDAPTPTVQRSGVVRLLGDHTTPSNVVIKYANASTRFCWLQGPNPAALYSTYGLLEIDGFTIDPNNRTGTGECGDVIWIQGDGNVRDVTIRNVIMLNNKPARTGNTQPACPGGILLICSHESRNQDHYGYTINVTIEDCTLYGGSKAIGVYAANRGTDTTYGASKYLIDNVNVARCACDINGYYGSTIHLGSYAGGYRCSVVDCTNADSTDDGVEIDAFNEVLVSGCTFTSIRQAICFTWFSYPWLSTTPRYQVRDCHYTGGCGRYWPNGADGTLAAYAARRAPMMPEFLDGGRGMNDRDHGNLFVSGCTAEYGVTDTYSTSYARAIVTSNSRLASVSISDTTITDAQGDVPDFIYLKQPAATGVLSASIYNVRQRTATNGAYALLTASQVALSGEYSIDSDIPGLT